MKVGEIARLAIATTPNASAAADTSTRSPVRYVFGRMHGAYGNQWLDKWRTGKLDATGTVDLGVKSAMSDWSIAMVGYEQAAIEAACVAVIDPKRRPRNEFPPSLPEFLAFCSSIRKAPPTALQDRSQETDGAEGRSRIARIRVAQLAERAEGNSLNRLHDLIAGAVQLAGGTLEQLSAWTMIATGDRDGNEVARKR